MNVIAELSIIRGRLASLETRLTDVRGGAGPGGVAAHHLTHEPGGADEVTLVSNATDADTLDSQHAADFLGVGDMAADSDKLDGQHAADFQAAGIVPAHHGSHEGAGGGAGADKIKLDDLDTPDNNTDLNASAAHHGLLPMLSAATNEWLRGDGTWHQITAGGSNVVKLWTPDALPAGYAAQCDHFDDASIAAKWTVFQAAAALTVTEGDSFIKFTDTGAGGYIYRGLWQTLPAGDFTMITKWGYCGTVANYTEIGLMLFEDAANNPDTCKLQTWNWFNANQLRSLRLTNKSTFSAAVGTTNPYGMAKYLRMRRSGTTLYMEWSIDGFGWILAYSAAQWFVPAQMGFVTSNQIAGVTEDIWFDFFFYKNSNDPNMNAMGAVKEFWVT